METTIDVAGLSEDRIGYLKDLVAIWKAQGEDSGGPQVIIKWRVAPSKFIVENSYVAMAYSE